MHKKIFALIVVDQITKLIFSPRDFFVGFMHVHLVKNYGLGFSLNFGLLPNLIIVAAALIFFLYYYFSHQAELSWRGKIVFVLIFAGAISNIIDRLYLGYVRDFLDLGLGFTFNLADAFVVIGLIIIIFTQSKPKDIIEI
ncbi:MAG: signal peptidase II [Candidatus Doudnabacteria bacterium]